MKQTGTATAKAEVSKQDWVKAAIVAIRNAATGKQAGKKGIHTVFTGFNEAYRLRFPGSDPVADVKAMVAEGKFQMHPSFRGAMLYLPGEMTVQDSATDKGKKALALVGV